MARQTTFQGATDHMKGEDRMHTRAITPTIGVTIGQQMRLFHAFVTTAPAVLMRPRPSRFTWPRSRTSQVWQRIQVPSTPIASAHPHA
jgi:hypothetical protein